MPLASDIILDWIAEDGYSLSETGRIRAQDHQFYFEVTAEKDGQLGQEDLSQCGSVVQVRLNAAGARLVARPNGIFPEPAPTTRDR